MRTTDSGSELSFKILIARDSKQFWHKSSGMNKMEPEIFGIRIDDTATCKTHLTMENLFIIFSGHSETTWRAETLSMFRKQ